MYKTSLLDNTMFLIILQKTMLLKMILALKTCKYLYKTIVKLFFNIT